MHIKDLTKEFMDKNKVAVEIDSEEKLKYVLNILEEPYEYDWLVNMLKDRGVIAIQTFNGFGWDGVDYYRDNGYDVIELDEEDGFVQAVCGQINDLLSRLHKHTIDLEKDDLKALQRDLEWFNNMADSGVLKFENK